MLLRGDRKTEKFSKAKNMAHIFNINNSCMNYINGSEMQWCSML